ncbi:MAG: type IV secretory system conjugative DNA transfer family protein, partial [Blastocatellia bacterium]
SQDTFFLQKALSRIAKREDGNPLLAYNEQNLIRPTSVRRSYEINGGISYYHVWRFPVFVPCKGLDWLVEEPFKKFTVENGSQSPDFAKLRNNKVIAYLDLTDLENKETNPLSSLFFTIALEQLKQSDNTNTTHIFIDELTSIGQIPNLPIDIGIVRRFNIGLVLATSDLDKLRMIYGLDNAKLIVGNGLDLSSVDEIERIYACD